MWYKPLDKTKNEIRVLKFLNLSSSVSNEDTIRCSIRNVSLGTSRHLQSHHDSLQGQKIPIAWDRFTKSVELRDSTLEQTADEKIAYARLLQSSPLCSGSRYHWGDFEALSYTWGNTGETKIIYVNGVRKNVPSNLEEALRALRNLEETLLGMCYWIDSLCIDQENIEERNEQVKRMKEIYGRARAVIVWLGQEEETDSFAVHIMHGLLGLEEICDDEEYESAPPGGLAPFRCPALFAFAQKPYWNRCWIIQELAMNHNSTLFMCGKYKLTRGMLRSSATYHQRLLRVFEEYNHQPDHRLQLEAWDIVDHQIKLIDLDPETDIGLGRSTLLDLVRRADATDERDKIYSILGLLDPAISAGVTPDYSLSVQQVYTDFIKSVINALKRLDHIAFVDVSAEQGWSSWVPDWRKPFQRYYDHFMIPPHASRDIPARFRFIEKERDRTYLACSGFRVDTVDGIAAEPPLDSHATRSSTVPDRYSGQTLKAIQRSFTMGYPTVLGGIPFKVPWNLRRDTNDSLANMPSNPEWLEISQSRHFERWDKFRKYNKDFCIGGQNFRSFFTQSDEEGVDIELTLRGIREAIQSLDYRVLITTNTGYVGLTPVLTRPGDVIAILFGCNSPVVLRPCDEGLYQVIGECYIHGLMYGEILDQQRDGHVSEQEFVLC